MAYSEIKNVEIKGIAACVPLCSRQSGKKQRFSSLKPGNDREVY